MSMNSFYSQIRNECTERESRLDTVFNDDDYIVVVIDGVKALKPPKHLLREDVKFCYFCNKMIMFVFSPKEGRTTYNYIFPLIAHLYNNIITRNFGIKVVRFSSMLETYEYLKSKIIYNIEESFLELSKGKITRNDLVCSLFDLMELYKQKTGKNWNLNPIVQRQGCFYVPSKDETIEIDIPKLLSINYELSSLLFSP